MDKNVRKICPILGKYCTGMCALYDKNKCALLTLARNTNALTKLAQCVHENDFCGKPFHEFNVSGRSD